MIKKTLAILAGGKSSRMNYRNKALLSYKNKTFIKHIIDAGKSFEEIIIISNNSEIYEEYGIKIVEDIYKDKGPLGGIYSALLKSKFDKVLCIACDMPLISEYTLAKIGEINLDYDVLIPMVDDRLQPLCAVYSKDIIGNIENSLINNENKLQSLIMKLNYKIIDSELNRLDFKNINTEDEYKELDLI